MQIKTCASHISYCPARIRRRGKSLCCRYGWCEWAVPVPTSEVEEHDFKDLYWQCWNCGERNHDDFIMCWKCHKANPEDRKEE